MEAHAGHGGNILACWPRRCRVLRERKRSEAATETGEGEEEGTETEVYKSARGERASYPKLTLASRHAARPLSELRRIGARRMAKQHPTSTRRSMAGVSRGRSRPKGVWRPGKARAARSARAVRAAGVRGGLTHGKRSHILTPYPRSLKDPWAQNVCLQFFIYF